MMRDVEECYKTVTYREEEEFMECDRQYGVVPKEVRDSIAEVFENIKYCCGIHSDMDSIKREKRVILRNNMPKVRINRA